MKNKPKFDKQKCARCVYRRKMSGCYTAKIGKENVSIICNYAAIAGKTCLRRVSSNEVIDIRGNDFHNCELFIEGEAIENDEAKRIFKNG